MTELERKIITLLQDNSRLSFDDIAVMTGSNKQTIESCVQSLQAKGIIVKYTTVVNVEKTGDEFVDALIEVKVTPQARSGFDSIAEEIVNFPEVKSVYLMSGTFDLAITIEGKTVRDVSLFVSERLSTLDCVTGTATHFIMKKYKEGGVALDLSNEKKRLPFSE